MKIKDIVNRDLVNLTNCEHEPIHIPGSIQPHGFLLGLAQGTFTISYCSGNTFEFINISYEELLGKSFASVFGEDQGKKFDDYLSSGDKDVVPLELAIAGKVFTSLIHNSNGVYILELEPKNREVSPITAIYRQTRQFVSYMEKATGLQMLCQAVADETRAITGYDRVMIYRFDASYNGEVFAESKSADIEPFLGLHYPHTDIPVQARELYVRNLIRLIVDVNYQPVPIYTLDDAPQKNLDLSLSRLRSVSPIHIQYLHNMGVGATLTISLIHENRLWGLITCHHYSAKYIDNYTRISAQLQGHFLTSQINVRQVAEDYAIAVKVNVSLDSLLTKMFSSDDISLEMLVRQPETLNIVNAAGVVIMIKGELFSHGLIPPHDEVKKLANWLNIYTPNKNFFTSNISLLYNDAAKWGNAAAGLIFHPLGSGPNDFVMWLRPETLKEVHWAGDPEKAIIKDEKGLSPRKSFELWKQVKKCESKRWSNPEIAAASNFANALQKTVYMLFLHKEELKFRQLSERLKETNSELENMNWISTHDLKEPLRKIRLFASRILDQEHEGVSLMILESVQKMNESATRMQKLITDILSYSRLSHINESLTTVNLNGLLKEVSQDLHQEISGKNAVVSFSGLPEIHGIPFLLNQLFVNLIRNSLKFSNAGVVPRITISYDSNPDSVPAHFTTGTFHKITIQDNGIGFDNKFKDSIFNVFSRLHKTSEYGGSGVGLALCKKIMKNHNGFISAEGSPGKGSSFYLYFPVDESCLPM